MGPRTENVEKPFVFVCFFEGQSGDEDSREEFQLSSPDRLGGGRGRVNTPPGACFGGLGGLEGLKLVRGIYTPRGQRPRRI